MSFLALLLACVAALNLWVGFYVYRQNPGAAPHRAFGFMATTIALWTTGLATTHYAPGVNPWPLRFAFAAASLIPIGVLAFVEETPVRFIDRWQLRRRLFTPVSIALAAASFSPWIVVSVTLGRSASVTVHGPLYPAFVIFVITCLAHSVCVWAVRYRRATGLTKLQLRHLVPAFAIASGLVIVTNLIVPILFNTSDLSKFGPLFTLPPLALVGHSIIRHHLLDLRVVVRHSAVYLAASCCAGLALVALLSASNAIIREEHGIPLPETLLALSVAILFGPLKTRIQRAFDRYLYREPYDYPRTIREASRALRGTIDLVALLESVTTVVDQTLKPEGAAVYLFDEDERHFRLVRKLPGTGFPDTLPTSSPLVSEIRQRRETLFRDERAPAENVNRNARALAFAGLGADVVIPLIDEREVTGLLCINAKRSGDPYFSDDADLLATLANQLAVAIRNAQTHQRIVHLNQELQTILSTIEIGVVAVSARGRIALFNRAAERLTGMAAASARGQRVEHLPAPLAKSIAGTIGDGEPRSPVEFSLPDAAGRLVPIVASTSPLLNPARQLRGAVAVFSDVSHLKALEQEKGRAERLASIEAIASGLVHEIRNPLVAIKTFSQLLPTRYQDSEFRETFSRLAGREIRRIDTLLTRFRTLASASSQPMESVDVTDPIRATLALLGPQLDEHEIRVRQMVDGTPRPILGNIAQLEQLFLNLCLNAMEAMGAGGELTLRVADLTEGGGATLLVEVSDTGVGIPEELLASIFNPFTTTKRRGSGLGLAICRSIADAHRARLSARSNPGRPGSTFTVEFPVPAPSSTL